MSICKTLYARKQLLETQLVITDLINKNMALEQENQRLKEHESDPLIWRNAKYWKDGDDVPFCPICYESPERYRYHLTPYSPTAGAIAYTCGHCKRYS